MRRLPLLQRRLVLWLASLALLMAAVAPALSHAMRSEQGPSWVELCSAQGPVWLKLDPNGMGEHTSPTPTPPFAAHALEHCPYCALHTDTLGVPPSPRLPTWQPMQGDTLPRAFLAAPRTLHAWVSAQPRAPPLAA